MKELEHAIEKQRETAHLLSENLKYNNAATSEQKAGTNTLKGIVAKNRSWFGALLIGLIILLLSMLAHVNGLL